MHTCITSIYFRKKNDWGFWLFSYKSPVTIFKIVGSTLKRSEKSMSAYNEAWGRKGNEIKR